MTEVPDGIVDRFVDRFVTASAEFARRLRQVRPGQWAAPTPCPDWTVRQLVNHMTRGNLNYLDLLRGGSSADFLRRRDRDALGHDPVRAYVGSVRDCAEAFGQPLARQRELDYPLGRILGRQALAVRTADTVIHTWDLARAIGADERLDPGLVAWLDEQLTEIYAGLAESPVSAKTTHRFFAAANGKPAPGASRQDRLLHRMGRDPR